jgi:hypothetical protein
MTDAEKATAMPAQAATVAGIGPAEQQLHKLTIMAPRGISRQ